MALALGAAHPRHRACARDRVELLAAIERLRSYRRAVLSHPLAEYFGVAEDAHGVREPRRAASSQCAPLAVVRSAPLAGDEPTAAPNRRVAAYAPVHADALALPVDPPLSDVAPSAGPRDDAAVADNARAGDGSGSDAAALAVRAAPATSRAIPSAPSTRAPVPPVPLAFGVRAGASAGLRFGLVSAAAAAEPSAAWPAGEGARAVEQQLELPAGCDAPHPACAPLSISSCSAGLVLVTHATWADIWELDTPPSSARSAQPASAAGGRCDATAVWRHAARVHARLAHRAARPIVASSLRSGGTSGERLASHVALVALPLPGGGPALAARGEGDALITTYTLTQRAERGAAREACTCELIHAEELCLPVSALGGGAAVARCGVRSVHAVSSELAVLALLDGRAAVWGVASSPAPPSSPPDQGHTGEGRIACRVHALPPPPWTDAPARAEPPCERDGASASNALALHVPCWSNAIALGACARGVAVWSLERRTLLLCFGSPAVRLGLAVPCGCAPVPGPEHPAVARDVLCAPYVPSCTAEVATLSEHARHAAMGSVARPAEPPAAHGASVEPALGSVVALLLLALRPCEGGDGFWARLWRKAAAAERSGDDDGGENASPFLSHPSPHVARARGARAASDDPTHALTIHLVALTPAELSSVREYAPPPSLAAAVRASASARACGAPSVSGWDEMGATARVVAALSRAADVLCVWDALTCACVVTVRVRSGRVMRALISSEWPLSSQPPPTGGGASWALWLVTCDAAEPAPTGATLRATRAQASAPPQLLGKRPHALVHAPAASPARVPLRPLSRPAAGVVVRHTPGHPMPLATPACAVSAGCALAAAEAMHPAASARPGFVGFRTGAGSKLALSSVALERAKRLLLDDDE